MLAGIDSATALAARLARPSALAPSESALPITWSCCALTALVCACWLALDGSPPVRSESCATVAPTGFCESATDTVTVPLAFRSEGASDPALSTVCSEAGTGVGRAALADRGAAAVLSAVTRIRPGSAAAPRARPSNLAFLVREGMNAP